METQSTHTRSPRSPGSMRSLLTRAMLLAGLLAGGVLAGNLVAEPAATPVEAEAVAFEAPIVPETSTDGVLRFVLPEGAYDAFARDEAGFVMPSVLRMEAGDRIEIVNEDSGSHMVFYSFVPAGTTVTLPFDEPGTFTYSSGCAVNPRMNSFTTLIVEAA
jgi:plastocyanin